MEEEAVSGVKCNNQPKPVETAVAIATRAKQDPNEYCINSC